MGDDDQPRPGTGSCIKSIIVWLVNLLDFILGIALVGYGSLVISNGLPAVGVPLLSFGLLLFLSSTLAVIGYGSTKWNRSGMTQSALMGMIIGPLEITIGVGIEVFKDKVFQYMRDHQVQLSMTDKVVDDLESISWFLMTAFCVLGLLEVCRFFMMNTMRTILIHNDQQIVDGGLNERLLSRGISNSNIIPEDQPVENSSFESESEREKRWTQMLEDGDAMTVGTKDSQSITSQDDFAPVDEPLYTDPHWWAKSSKDTENDMSWVTSASNNKGSNKTPNIV